MARTATAEVLNLSQLDMVLEARQVLLAEGATPAEWAANSTLINRYSQGAWIAEGTAPARRADAVALPTPTADYQPTERPLPSGGSGAVNTRPAIHPDNAVTDNQRDLVTRLATAHLDPEAAAAAIALCDQRTKRTISPLIASLLELEKHNRKQATRTAKTAAQLDAELPTVATGRYAVLDAYFKIDNGTGRWQGRVFIREIDADGNEIADVRDPARKLEIMTAVAADPNAAVIAYGKATGTCGICERHLEDPDSVDRGIGPYCEADMLGIPVSAVYRMRKAARTAAAPAAEAPAPATEITQDAPATPAPADDLDSMTFAQVMTLAKQLKVPGRGTARLPELRAGVRTALAEAAA